MITVRQLIFENIIKHATILAIAILLWNLIFEKISMSDDAALSAIAVIISLIALAALTAYFNFSFSIVSKKTKSRFIGYLCTFLLFLSFTLSIEVILAIAIVWIPSLSFVWIIILVSLFIGSIIFDHLDLMKIGLDTAAINFFEKGTGKDSETKSLITMLEEGKRLPVANAIIGQIVIDLGNKKGIEEWVKTGEWIVKNAHKEQYLIDSKIAELFESTGKKDKRIGKIIEDLKKGQSQQTADALIGRILEIADKEY